MFVFRCRIIWADDKCDGKESLGRLVEIHDDYDIDGVLGLPCSFGNKRYNVCIGLWTCASYVVLFSGLSANSSS